MGIILSSITFVFALIFNQDVDVEKLRKDPTLIAYKAITHKIKEGIINKKYVLPSNFFQLSQELGHNPTPEDTKKKLMAAGMKNVEDFVNEINQQTNLMNLFLKKHPQLQKLDNSTKKNVIAKLLSD